MRGTASRGAGERSSAVLGAALILYLLPLAVAASVRAAESPIAVPVTGSPFPARIVLLDEQGKITFESQGQQRTLSAEELVYWGECREPGRAGGLVLVDGGFLAAEVNGINQASISARSQIFGQIQLPRDRVAGIVFTVPISTADADKLRERALRENRRLDRVLLENRDEIAGTILAMNADSLQLKTDLGDVDMPLERVTALVFDPRGRKPEGGPRCWTGFSDGSRLLASRLLLTADSLQMEIGPKTWKTSPKELVFLQPLGGRTVYLSDLEVSNFQQTPYLGTPWPYGRDRSVSGNLLRFDGHLYLKGLGVHSHTKLVYTLPSGAKRFEAEVAIDDSGKGQGSVQFRVLVDGRERFLSGVVRGGDRPVPVSVDVRGGENLELVVDYADRADVLDRANWLNARLIR